MNPPRTTKTPGWIEELRSAVELRLKGFFEDKSRQARTISPRAVELIDTVARLTMRGGKRLRPVVLYAGFRAVKPDGPMSAVVEAAAALELLQSYLLTHDDWMDQDDRRRGGPSVHAELRAVVPDQHLADSLAILCGDLASGYGWELLNRAPFPLPRRQEALDEFSAMHQEVIYGQQLDLLADPDVALVHHLKTGSYTVRGPLRLGAILADAGRDELDALARFGAPLGTSFQLRDDLLGLFGDSRKLGKQAGNDLLAGKNTAVVAEARQLLKGEQLQALQAVLGNRNATATQVGQVVDLLQSCGARQRVEERMQALLQQARDSLSGGPLPAEAAQSLLQLVDLLTDRDR